jgi:hypothetical protein
MHKEVNCVAFKCVWPLAISCGSNMPPRSRGTAISTSLSSVRTVFAAIATPATGWIALGTLDQGLFKLFEKVIVAGEVLGILIVSKQLIQQFRLF